MAQQSKDEQLWTVSRGDLHRIDAGRKQKTVLFSALDDLAMADGASGPILIDSKNESVIDAAAEYAAQKGYELVSATPEQNLRIITKQNAMAGEEISEGTLAHAGLEMVDDAASGKDPAALKKPQEEKELDDPAADIAKIAEEMRAAPDPFKTAAQKQQKLQQEAEDAAAKKAKDREPFPIKKPAEIIEKRMGFAAVRDHGNRFVVTRNGMSAFTPGQARAREARIEATLMKARERFGDPIRVKGTRSFEKKVIEHAIANGIPLEMATMKGQKRYMDALEHGPHRNRDRGTMEPSSPAPSREKKREKGLELSL